MSLRLTPHHQTVAVGQSIAFHAAVYDPFGHPLRTQPAVTYSILSGPGKIDPATGLFSSPNPRCRADSSRRRRSFGHGRGSGHRSVKFLGGSKRFIPDLTIQQNLAVRWRGNPDTGNLNPMVPFTMTDQIGIECELVVMRRRFGIKNAAGDTTNALPAAAEENRIGSIRPCPLHLPAYCGDAGASS